MGQGQLVCVSDKTTLCSRHMVVVTGADVLLYSMYERASVNSVKDASSKMRDM